MIWIYSKLGLLLVVFTLAFGEQGKDSAQLKPASEKAKLRDWFFRLSLRNDLIKLKEDGQDYLPVVKLHTDDGEGEDFSILVDEDHPHPNNNCKSESTSEDKEMRFVMRGLDQEFMCTEIKKKIPDVPEERSMTQTDTSRRGSKVNFIEDKNKVEEGETNISEEQSDKALDDSEHRDEEPGTDEDIDQIIASLQNIADTDTESEITEGNVKVEPVLNAEDSEEVNLSQDFASSRETQETSTSIGEDSVQEQDATEIITNSNKIVETITSSFALEFETAAVEKESTTRQELKEPEVYAEDINDKNKTKTLGGLAPLIDHLNGVASHQQFEDPFYVKTIQDLVKDFRKHNLSEATWDQDKLNTILDKIEELVTGDKADDWPVEVTEASKVEESVDWQLLSVDVEKMQQELETLSQISPQVNPENQPDISTVYESPEARMADSQSDGRVIGEKQNSAGKDDRATTMEKVINDLRKFVDVAANTEKPDMRSADSDGDNRSKTITDVNATSGESISSANASTTEEPVQIETTGNASTTEEPVQIETTGNASTTEEPLQIGDETTLLSSVNLATEESASKDGATDDTHTSEAATTEEMVVEQETTSVPNGSLTTENTAGDTLNDSTEVDALNDSTEVDALNESTTVNFVSGGESAAQSLNDTETYDDYSSEGLINMLSSWKKKFFIILGCFIVSMVLFLIIIAVLIYKVQQNKPAK